MKAFVFIGEKQFSANYLENIIATFDHAPSVDEISQQVEELFDSRRHRWMHYEWVAVLLVNDDGTVEKQYFSLGAGEFPGDSRLEGCETSFFVPGRAYWYGLRPMKRVEDRNDAGTVWDVEFVPA